MIPIGAARLCIGEGSASMNETLEALKRELERFGSEHDAATSSVPHRMLNVTRDTGAFLGVLVRAMLARRILEIGTSNGYSTLWLAEAATAIGGSVTTIELDSGKLDMASSNFRRSGLASVITQVHDDAGIWLPTVAPGSYDMVFLDSERVEYPGWWPFIDRVLRPGGLLVVDNATSHPAEVEPLFALITTTRRFATSLVPIGKGEFLAVGEASARS